MKTHSSSHRRARAHARYPTTAIAAVVFAAVLGLLAAPAHAEQRSFAQGSLIIPMDQEYQDRGMFQAYGLLFQLLRQGVTVYWIVDQDKSWHAAPCDQPGDECAWDCRDAGSGIKCAYPTAGPDFYAEAQVVWDDQAQANPGDPVPMHGYRGGPFVVDAAQAATAMDIIDTWNDPSLWTNAPWAARTVFHVTTVHQTTGEFSGWVVKTMFAAPTIAVFSDGNEDIATGYLRAAGIPQSNSTEFPAAKCGNNNCGPGTVNPDMLTVPSIMGDMGTCDAINYNHKNGSLFTDDGLPAYCQIMSMHWNVNDRETVQCNGGGCPATQADCSGETITYHGHEVVAEVRSFLEYPVHFFAECQAVNAYENTVPNPAWPFLDDAGRNGHFLTTTGNPPPCPQGTCTDGDFECVVGGCDNGAVDCCLPSNIKEQGAGFMIAAQPNGDSLQILRPDVAYNQRDGAYQTVGGSEPAYNLSTYLGTEYKNNRDVTFLTGPNGPGDQDVWMSGFIDGECDVTGGDDVGVPAGECNSGKVSYLGGHQYSTNVPMSSNGNSQGTRLFLNALFEADCVTSVGQPSLSVTMQGDLVLPAQTVPADGMYQLTYANQGRGLALDAVLAQIVPIDVTVVSISDQGNPVSQGVEWALGSISADAPVAGDPPSQGTRQTTLQFPDYGEYQLMVELRYRVGLSWFQTPAQSITVRVVPDSDGDGVGDADDPAPNDPNACGDSDADTCDDCVSGTFDPANDGPDADSDGICDAGEGPGANGDAGGCCQSATSPDLAALALLCLLVVLALAPRRRRRRACH